MKVTCDNCGCVMVGDKSIEAEHRSAALDLALELNDSTNLAAPMKCPVCSEPPHKIFYACGMCGSTSVMVQEWVNPNTEQITPIPEVTRMETESYELVDWLEDGGDEHAVSGHEILKQAGVCLEALLDYDPKKERKTQGEGRPSPYCLERAMHDDLEDGELAVPVLALSREQLKFHQEDCWWRYNDMIDQDRE